MTISRHLILLLIVLFHLAAAVNGQTTNLSEYAGRYTDGRDYAVYFERSQYGLTIRPVLWTATQLLEPVAKDKFEVEDRRSRGAEFTRDAAGRVNGVTIKGMDGEGLTLVRATMPLLAVELFLNGRVREAAAAYSKQPGGATKALDTAQRILERMPTKTRTVVAFLNEISAKLNKNVRYHSLVGYAYVQAGDRRSALAGFQRGYKLDPNDPSVLSGLARLGQRVPPSTKQPWKLPFPVSSVFAKPTAAEIRAVEADWALRDLSARGIVEETNGTVTFGDWTAGVRIVSHLVQGSRHYGAIIYPLDAKPGSCPIIVSAKGVSPNYFPLNIESSPNATFMGELSPKFIYVFPSFRGEVLNFNGKSYTSEGDRRDALDGATDDSIALLNVALATTPAGDKNRICAYGHSRGGNVALLIGIRDPRIDCVVDIAGPTDWFYLMGTEGWSEEELWAEAIRTHANTDETGGQNLERFGMRAIEGKADLEAVRHNMIASSPLYFAKRLPKAQLHYGIEDPSVPVRNGYEFVAELRRSGVPRSRYQAFFYPGQGHDTDHIAAPIAARVFVAESLHVR